MVGLKTTSLKAETRSLLGMTQLDALNFSYEIEEAYLNRFLSDLGLSAKDKRIVKDLSLHTMGKTFMVETRICYYKSQVVFFSEVDFLKNIITIQPDPPGYE